MVLEDRGCPGRYRARLAVGPDRDIDLAVHDASFLKIQNINLEYKLPNKILDRVRILSNMSVFATATDPFVFTSYPGPAPESYSRDAIQGASLDNDAFPRSRTFSFGVKLTSKYRACKTLAKAMLNNGAPLEDVVAVLSELEEKRGNAPLVAAGYPEKEDVQDLIFTLALREFGSENGDLYYMAVRMRKYGMRLIQNMNPEFTDDKQLCYPIPAAELEHNPTVEQIPL